MTADAPTLHPIITRNLDLMGYGTPRPIQAQALAPILAGRDLIGLAKTGSGKTAAFLAPLAHLLLSNKPEAVAVKVKNRRGRTEYIDPQSRLRALVLCPTRELTQQVADEAARIMQGSVLRVACAYGKVAINPQAKQIARGVDVLVATPGRVRELVDDGHLSLTHIRHVAIDEADRMLDMGFLPQVQKILASIPLAANPLAMTPLVEYPPGRAASLLETPLVEAPPGQTAHPLAASRESHLQIILFTSTMPKQVEDLARQFLHEPVRIESDPHSTPVAHVRQHLVPVDNDDKVSMVLHLVLQGHRGGVLVFCRTRRRVGWVNTALLRNDISSVMLHGDMSQAQRTRSLQVFTSGERRVLVATDVAGRGLHIPAVKTVINYDLPPTPEEYVHRMGRAAHGMVDGVDSKSPTTPRGEVFTLLSKDTDEKLKWRAILNTLGVEVFAEEIEGFAPDRSHRRAAHPPRSGRPARSHRSDARTEKLARQDHRDGRGDKPSRVHSGVARSEKPARLHRSDARSEKPARVHRGDARSEKPSRVHSGDARSERVARSSFAQPGATAKPSHRGREKSKSQSQKNKRSRKGRPIKKGEKPGRGVVRPA